MRFTPREAIRLPRDQYLGLRIYFVTICAEHRKSIFDNPQRCALAIEALQKISQAMDFLIHAYCVMPDHAHFLAEGRRPTSDLVRFVGRWKQTTGYLFRDALPARFWQRRFHDYILRKSSESEAIAWYIWLNPVRKGMVASPEQYPYSGSFTVEWPRIARCTASDLWVAPWKRAAGTRETRAPTTAPVE